MQHVGICYDTDTGLRRPSTGRCHRSGVHNNQARKVRHAYTSLAAATGAGGNSTALVGTPETVAEALLDYVDLGATTLLIRGYDPYDDAIDYGRELIPLVREGVRRRDEAAAKGTIVAPRDSITI